MSDFEKKFLEFKNRLNGTQDSKEIESIRIDIFSNRVCPLQLSWLAFCNTVGFDDIDYLINNKNKIEEFERKRNA